MSLKVFAVSGQTSSISAGAFFTIALRTGAEPVVLLDLAFAFGTGTASTAGNVTLWEAPTGLGAGSAIPSFRFDRNATYAATMVVEGGNSVTTPGTQAGATAYYRGIQSTGISATPALCHRLKPNTNYVLRVQNTDAAAQVADIYVAWYEGQDIYPVGV